MINIEIMVNNENIVDQSILWLLTKSKKKKKKMKETVKYFSLHKSDNLTDLFLKNQPDYKELLSGRGLCYFY